MTMRLVMASIGLRDRLAGATQGFIDQHGNFYTRDAAWTIAYDNHQIIRDTSKCVGTLYSEHLY